MHEHIRTGILNDEPKPMPVIEPFYFATGHSIPLPRFKAANPKKRLTRAESPACDQQPLPQPHTPQTWPRIRVCGGPVKRSFLAHCAGERSLDLQGLIEELGKVVQDGCLADEQGYAGGLGGGLKLRGVFAAKGDDRQVFGGGVLFEAGKGGTDIVLGGFQIGQHQHGFGLLGAFHELARVRNGLDAIVQVLEPVDKLAAGQQLLIKHKREGLRHGPSLERPRPDCKGIRARGRKLQGCIKLAVPTKSGRDVSPKRPCLGGYGRLGEASLPDGRAPHRA